MRQIHVMNRPRGRTRLAVAVGAPPDPLFTASMQVFEHAAVRYSPRPPAKDVRIAGHACVFLLPPMDVDRMLQGLRVWNIHAVMTLADEIAEVARVAILVVVIRF